MPRPPKRSAQAQAKHQPGQNKFTPVAPATFVSNDSDEGSVYTDSGEDEIESDGSDSDTESITALCTLYSVFLPSALREKVEQKQAERPVSYVNNHAVLS
jgi:hypothetical protein